MNQTGDQPGRLHAFDNLRAIMMWLGIALHVAANHMAGESVMPWRDQQTSIVADLTILFIHAFRMPVFFILAGYFVAMLVRHRGIAGMLKHRLRRIALPFVLFWPVLFIATGALVLMYVHLMVHGTIGLDPLLVPSGPSPRPMINTLHMWFIYYLFWLCVLAAPISMLGKYIPARVKDVCDRAWKTIASSWWGWFALAVPLAMIGSFYRGGLVVPTGSFIPQAGEFLQCGLFFGFGWMLYRYPDVLLPLYSKNCWRNIVAGILPFFAALILLDSFTRKPGSIGHIEFWIALAYNCATWLWSIGLIGLSARYLSRQNRFLRYLSESSYWVFLVHMLGTIGFGILLYDLPLNAITKMAINIAATSLMCIATYHWLVRRSMIGVLLNGRRFHSLKA